MRKIFTRLLLTLAAISVLFAMPLTVSAEAGRVFDQSGVLTSEEVLALEAELEQLAVQTGWNLALVTTDDAQGKNTRDYADDFYDELYGIDTNGVVYLIDFDNRQSTISTSGEAIDYLTDSRIEDVLTTIDPYLAEQSYSQAMSSFISGVSRYYIAGIPEGQHRVSEEDVRRNTLLIALAVGAVAMGISVLVIVGRYKFHSVPNAATYLDQGETLFLERSDNFLREYTTSVKIESNSNSGGGSSTHTSSGGGTHGGGSHSF